MFCLDLTLRVFSASFQHIQTVHVTSTVLWYIHKIQYQLYRYIVVWLFVCSMEFVESTSTLYTGQSGTDTL